MFGTEHFGRGVLALFAEQQRAVEVSFERPVFSGRDERVEVLLDFGRSAVVVAAGDEVQLLSLAGLRDSRLQHDLFLGLHVCELCGD